MTVEMASIPIASACMLAALPSHGPWPLNCVRPSWLVRTHPKEESCVFSMADPSDTAMRVSELVINDIRSAIDSMWE